MGCKLIAGDYGPVGDIEILWTLIALFGIGFSIYNVREAFKDVKSLHTHNIRNGRAYIARSFRMSEVTRLIMQLIFLTIGVISMTIYNIPRQDLPLKLQIFSFIFTWGLITAATMTALQSYLAFRIRQYIRAGTFESKSSEDLGERLGDGIAIEGTIKAKEEKP